MDDRLQVFYYDMVTVSIPIRGLSKCKMNNNK